MNVEGKKFISPLLCFDIYSEYYRKLLEQLRKDADVRQVKSILKGKIGDSIEDLIQLETYDALVITDPYQNIVWVSDGFQEMTGYPKKHVLGKRPSFLQGPRTSKVSRQQIRNGLEQDRHFAGSILNYRKNGESYLCQIKIVPIYDSKSVLVNFLALEKELLVA